MVNGIAYRGGVLPVWYHLELPQLAACPYRPESLVLLFQPVLVLWPSRCLCLHLNSTTQLLDFRLFCTRECNWYELLSLISRSRASSTYQLRWLSCRVVSQSFRISAFSKPCSTRQCKHRAELHKLSAETTYCVACVLFQHVGVSFKLDKQKTTTRNFPV